MAPDEPTSRNASLDEIKSSLRRARDLDLFIADAEERLAKAKLAYFELTHTTLPDQFNSANVRSLTLDGEGNFPSYTCKLKPYYKAVIPAKWDDEKRKAALEELESHGAGDIVKRTVSVSFSLGEMENCEKFCKTLTDNGYTYKLSFDIPWQTLTSWLRESVEAGTMPDLEKIGGQVGQVVSLKSEERE